MTGMSRPLALFDGNRLFFDHFKLKIDYELHGVRGYLIATEQEVAPDERCVISDDCWNMDVCCLFVLRVSCTTSTHCNANLPLALLITYYLKIK